MPLRSQPSCESAPNRLATALTLHPLEGAVGKYACRALFLFAASDASAAGDRRGSAVPATRRAAPARSMHFARKKMESCRGVIRCEFCNNLPFGTSRGLNCPRGYLILRRFTARSESSLLAERQVSYGTFTQLSSGWLCSTVRETKVRRPGSARNAAAGQLRNRSAPGDSAAAARYEGESAH